MDDAIHYGIEDFASDLAWLLDEKLDVASFLDENDESYEDVLKMIRFFEVKGSDIDFIKSYWLDILNNKNDYSEHAYLTASFIVESKESMLKRLIDSRISGFKTYIFLKKEYLS